MSWPHRKLEEWRCDQCVRVFSVIVERSEGCAWTVCTWVEGHRKQEACDTEQRARDVAQMAMNEHDQRFHMDSLWDAEGQ